MNKLPLVLKIKGILKYIFNYISAEVKHARENVIITKIFLAFMSIIISLIIWVFVAWDGNTDGTKNITIPITFTNLSKGYSLFPSTNKVTVKLADKIINLSHIQEDDLKATVDLKDLQIGKYVLPIRIDLQSSVAVAGLNPSTVEVEVYRNIERTIPLTWKIVGDEDPKAKIDSVEIIPDSVRINGPEIDVMSIQTVDALIPSDKIMKGEAIIVPVEIATDRSDLKKRVHLSHQQVSAKLKMKNDIKSQKVPVTISVTGVPFSGLELDTVRVVPEQVFVEGDSAVVDTVKAINLPPVDISGLDQDLQLLVPLLPLDLPSELTVVGPDRAKIDIKLRKKIKTRRFRNIRLGIKGATHGVNYKVSPEFVELLIEGPQSEIDKIDSNNLPCDVFVDVSNIVSKQIIIPILINKIKDGFTMIKVSPEEVLLTVTE
ncbi:MAG: CdaR family protein [Synergistaceae bacterium]